MIALGIENSNPSAVYPESGPAATVALAEVEGGRFERVIGIEPIDTSDARRDDLMCSIERLCERWGIRARQLGLVAVSAGPGGYTASRIAITAAKFLAEANGAACVAVPTALAVAKATKCPLRCGVVLASKGDSAWVTVFEGESELVDGRLATAQDLPQWGLRALIADRFIPQAFSAKAIELGIDVVPPVFCAAAVIELALGRTPVDPLDLRPIYPREPEAVTKWRQRQG